MNKSYIFPDKILDDLTLTVMPDARKIYTFGDFRLDTAERLLLRGSLSVPLKPKVFETLVILVEASGSLVTKDEFLKRLWPDTFATDESLAQNISQLRKALDNGTDGKSTIQTVPKQGYRFLGQVQMLEAETPPPVTQHLKGGLARIHRNTLSVAWKVLCTVVLCLCGFAIYRYFFSFKPPDFSDITATPITNSGEVDDYVAISPDGKLAVFGLLQHPYRMVVKQLATGSEITVIEGADSYYDDAVFSPNGEYIYYRHISGSASDLYAVPALGGPISHIAANVTSAVAFSPDGSRIAFRRPGSNGIEDIVISNADGTNPQVVFTSRKGMLVRGAPSWSRELDLLSFSIDDQERMGIAVVSPSGKLMKTFWYKEGIPYVQWVPNAGGMLFLTVDPFRMGRREFWFQPYPDGQHVRVTHDLTQYVGLSVTADGTSFLTSDSGQHSEIYVADVPLSFEHKINWNMKLFSREESVRMFSWMSWLADGRLLVEDSTWQLFTLQPDGSRRRVLPQAQNLGWLTSCGPGGTIIAIKYEEDLKPTIWKVNVDSGEMKQVTRNARDGFDVAPSCGINGKSIVYILGTNDGLFKTMRVSSEGGDPVQLISGGNWFSPPAVSPDGKLFAQILPDNPFVVATSTAAVRLNLYSMDDGKLVQSFGWQAKDPAHRQMSSPRWTADGQLTFKGCTELICEIYLQPVSGKPAMQLTNVGPSQSIRDFAWSLDNKKLAIALKRRNDTDAVLFTGIKPGR